MSKLMLYVGLGGLCHAAYSATQHRNYLRLTEKEYTRLPLDILLQTLACLLVTGFALIRIVGKFKSIRMSSGWESKTWEHIGNRTSFYTFNHRGKNLFGQTDEDFIAAHAQDSIHADDQDESTTGSSSMDEDEYERQKALIQQKIQEQQAKMGKKMTKEDLEDEEEEDVVITSGRKSSDSDDE